MEEYLVLYENYLNENKENNRKFLNGEGSLDNKCYLALIKWALNKLRS